MVRSLCHRSTFSHKKSATGQNWSDTCPMSIAPAMPRECMDTLKRRPRDDSHVIRIAYRSNQHLSPDKDIKNGRAEPGKSCFGSEEIARLGIEASLHLAAGFFNIIPEKFREGTRAGDSTSRSLSENPIIGGCWKMFRCKASDDRFLSSVNAVRNESISSGVMAPNSLSLNWLSNLVKTSSYDRTVFFFELFLWYSKAYWMAFETVMAQASFLLMRFVGMGLEALPAGILRCSFQMIKRTKNLVSIVFKQHVNGVPRS